VENEEEKYTLKVGDNQAIEEGLGVAKKSSK